MNVIINISYMKIDFACPYCQKQYKDDQDIYVERCNKSKDGIARVRCKCKKTFGMTYDMKGHAVSFEL